MYKSTNSELLLISYLLAVAFTLVHLKRVFCAGEGDGVRWKFKIVVFFYLRWMRLIDRKLPDKTFLKNQYFNT